MGKWAKPIGLLMLVAVFVIAFYEVGTDTAPEGQLPEVPSTPSPSLPPGPPAESRAPAPASASDGVLRVVQNAAIKNYGEVIYRGPVDLSATIDRIRAGVKHPHRNDGAVFGNRERLLPRKPRDYYREYVHPTEGISGPGPQRLVVGRDGDWWYTPDHYASFIELGQEVRQ